MLTICRIYFYKKIDAKEGAIWPFPYLEKNRQGGVLKGGGKYQTE